MEINTVIEAFKTQLRRFPLFLLAGSVIQNCSWVGGEMARLPWEKELGETPQGVKTTEEARQFPHRKASYFPTNPSCNLTVTDPELSRN